jgi:predicted ATPase
VGDLGKPGRVANRLSAGSESMEKNRTRVLTLEFGDPPFRKLGGLTLEFADRLTLIAGHNGIGKSTILGLVANTFGLTKEGGHLRATSANHSRQTSNASFT